MLKKGLYYLEGDTAIHETIGSVQGQCVQRDINSLLQTQKAKTLVDNSNYEFYLANNMPTLEYLNGFTCTAVQTDLSMMRLEHGTRDEVMKDVEEEVISSYGNTKPVNNHSSAKASSKSDTRNGKHKSNNSSSERILKKKRPVKHCILCKKHGGATASHNTYACKKYNKDGNLKSTWKYKSVKNKARKSNSKSYAQFDDRISKLEKNIKRYLKVKASHSHKKRRH